MADDSRTLAVGDMAHLGACFEKFQEPLLKAITGRSLHQPQLERLLDPGDILQSVFGRVADRWRRDPSACATEEYWWWYQLMDDEWNDTIRKVYAQKRDLARHEPVFSYSSIAFAHKLSGSIATPSKAYGRQEREQLVAEALEQIDEEMREILWMYFYDDLSCAEIGQVRRVSKATATRHLRKALSALGKLLPPGLLD
ncbi:MAG: sigma-70 family RNA polymerase sigma factor [Pirellulaceae bacterium]|nr:sigma-70 family RNA polymerase sigma factor [Pirellulaceae bacterium]